MIPEPVYADVLLPLPVPGGFTYLVPEELKTRAKLFSRVVVQFGQKKIYTAVIVRLHDQRPSGNEVKQVLSVLDDHPVINNIQYKLWTWMASYYMCHVGDVMNAALPSALKLASESTIMVNPAGSKDYSSLTDNEYLLIEAVSIQKKLTVNTAAKIIGNAKIIPVIKSLIEKGFILPDEEIREKYIARTVVNISLGVDYRDEEKLKAVFEQLERKAVKQLDVMMQYIRLTGNLADGSFGEIRRDKLLKEIKDGSAALSALVKKGILAQTTVVASRLGYDGPEKLSEAPVLTGFQQKAKDEIQTSFETRDVVLLHGVTASGKTEIYISIIAEMLKQGKQVLYLVPEIALTTHLISRLQKYFGKKTGVYHSRYNEQERVEIWNNVAGLPMAGNGDERYEVIIGPRSAMFLPFSDLGLVIIDEEHDYSFKQNEMAPRFNARDAGIYLARLHQAKVLLGSATPAIESYHNAKTGRFGYVSINSRYTSIELPEVMVADTRKDHRITKMNSHFTSVLLNEIENAVKQGEQVILFQNRRGYSLRIECETCNWMPECRNCDVTLTYHRSHNQLRCHYCGYNIRVPEKCGNCGSTNLKMKGFGTEKIEDEISLILPDARVRRMDLDTTTSKHAYQQILEEFGQGKTDILVGTQMVTKGLDFDNVSVVGIMNADNMMFYPDFRSFERSFQLMTQVSGRAGRKNKRGKVVIQSAHINHSVIKFVLESDYEGMFRKEITERRHFKYPPFFRLILLKLRHRDIDLLKKGAAFLAGNIRKHSGIIALGPEFPMVARIKNQYINHILVKLERKPGLEELKLELNHEIVVFYGQAEFKSIHIVVDVDPV